MDGAVTCEICYSVKQYFYHLTLRYVMSFVYIIVSNLIHPSVNQLLKHHLKSFYD
jgi:hypothetical protein